MSMHGGRRSRSMSRRPRSRGRGISILMSYITGCEKGYYQLWLFIRDPDVIGCGITQIVDEPYRRVLEIVAIGGRELKDWTHFEEHVGSRAKDEMGAVAVRVFCRPGIKHIIEPMGFKIKGFIMERPL
jgi:hypothetical protein